MRKLDMNKLKLVLFTIMTIVWGYVLFDYVQAFLKIGTLEHSSKFLEHPSEFSISNLLVSAILVGGSFAITLVCAIKVASYLVKVTSDKK